MAKAAGKFPAGMLCMVMIFSLFTVPAFAADGKTITYDYYYEADSPDDISYSVDKSREKIVVDGKNYRLKDIKTELYSEPITEKKSFKTKDKQADEYITRTVEGTEIKLYAPDKIKWKSPEKVTVTREYAKEADAPDTLEYEEKELVLKSVVPVSRTEALRTTAKFYADSKDAVNYQFNGKIVKITGGPVWSGYKDDYAEYFGISNKNEYSITGSHWIGGAKKYGSGYVRYAAVTGTKKVNHYVATFTTSEEDLVYTANVTYTSKYIAHAAVTYERYITTLQKLIYAGVGIGLLVLLTTLILFFLRRKRRDEEGDEDELPV